MDTLIPVIYTHDMSDTHTGGFSIQDEAIFGVEAGTLALQINNLHELVTLHRTNLAKNLEKYRELHIVKSEGYAEVKSGVFVHNTVTVDDQVIFNTTKGIIIIEEGVHINPFTYLAGPLRIDKYATINPHTNISGSYIGKYCKVGGEVANSVIEGYSNKGHYGYVGDSFIGSWVNLGGGTSTSNLKNTYGTIKMSGIDTGEQFLGAIICDYVKTAINTSIYTGKVIGVGSHIYGTVTTDVPNCVNYFAKDNITTIPIEVMEKTAKRMMARRSVEFTNEDKQKLELIYKNI